MTANLGRLKHLPGWVPDAVRLYLGHTEDGLSLRALARREGCHASTVLRQVRRFENRRDDPLVDEALTLLWRASAEDGACDPDPQQECRTMPADPTDPVPPGLSRPETAPPAAPPSDAIVADEATVRREARRILRRLNEPGAILAIASDMPLAAVLRPGPETADDAAAPMIRTAVVDRSVARAFALKDWIACGQPGRVASYRITAAGRAALRRMLAECAGDLPGEPGEGDDDLCQARPGSAETPVAMLGRRRDKGGRPFLSAELVAAAERLREDFEIAQMGPQVAQNWDRFLTAGVRTDAGGAPPRGPRAARERVAAALADLGPGLGDVALRCCCYLEGLEAVERRMGWAARSGKVVLRIALQRLRRHYDETYGRAGSLIG